MGVLAGQWPYGGGPGLLMSGILAGLATVEEAMDYSIVSI